MRSGYETLINSMRQILILLLGLSVLTLGAQSVEPAESTRSVPIKHCEFDYYNYSISGGQETLYLNLTMALRYNFFDASLWK